MQVARLESRGADRVVTCQSRLGSITGLHRGSEHLIVGQTVMVNVNWSSALLFEAVTGALLGSRAM